MSHVNRLSLTQLLSSRCGDLTRFEPELSLQLFQWRGHQFFGLTSRFSRISFRDFSRKLYRHHQTHQIFSPPPPLSPVAPAAFAFLSVG